MKPTEPIPVALVEPRKGCLGLMVQIIGDLFAGLRLLVTLTILVTLTLIIIYGGKDEPSKPVQPAPGPDIKAVPLPAVVTLTFEEASRIHGQPVSSDKATGWAMWPRFKARFVEGRCVEVAGL